MKWNTYLPSNERTKEQMKESIERTNWKKGQEEHICLAYSRLRDEEEEKKRNVNRFISQLINMNLDLIEVYKYLHLSSFFKRKVKRIDDDVKNFFFFLFLLSFFLSLVRSQTYYFSIWFSWQTRQLPERRRETVRHSFFIPRSIDGVGVAILIST